MTSRRDSVCTLALAPARTVILFVGTRNTRTRGGAANERSWTERGATADVIMSVTKDCGKFEYRIQNAEKKKRLLCVGVQKA
mmetsp:Transcript_43714/g.72820  ORF Transcript_43714/g.72820 Transcript_43714/m.72820 type:complete len:82 (+) Transcript_43714:275-520(+)